MKEAVIEYKYLNYVLNELGDEIIVEHPLARERLLEIDYANEKIAVEKPVILETYFKGVYSPRTLLKDSLQIAGLLPYLNIGEVVSYVKSEYEKIRPGEYKHPPLIMVALDTNVLYNWFISNYLQDVRELNILVSETVFNEIYYRMTKSVDDFELRVYRRLAQHFTGHTLDFKFEPLDSRKARLAYYEYEQLKNMFKVIPCKGERYGDIYLVKSYAYFRRETGADIILLTFDDKIRELARTHGLKTLYIKQQPNIGKIVFDYTKLPQLLYILATYFITITLRAKSKWATINILWKGKNSEDWLKGLVRVEGNINLEKLLKYIKLQKRLTSQYDT